VGKKVASPIQTAVPRVIEEKLKEILAQPGLLTFDQLKFIATEVLPLSSRLPSLERLEKCLRRDVYRRRKAYEDKYGINWEYTLLDPLEEIKELESLSLEEKIKRYLRAEALAEFELAHIQLLNKFMNGEINYDEYEKEIRNLAERICGELRII
jgi:hypothetical protein